MKTNTAPWDYEKRVVLVSKLVRLCNVCGNYVVDQPRGYKCLTCTNTHYEEVWEHDVDTFRCGLWQIEYEKSLYFAGLMPDIGGAMKLNWEGES
jgi:hypothetical protein